MRCCRCRSEPSAAHTHERREEFRGVKAAISTDFYSVFLGADLRAIYGLGRSVAKCEGHEDIPAEITHRFRRFLTDLQWNGWFFAEKGECPICYCKRVLVEPTYQQIVEAMAEQIRQDIDKEIIKDL